MDELFELCKKVYELTGWLPDELYQAYYHRGHHWSGTEEWQAEEPKLHEYEGTLVDFPVEFDCPLYTSDYLLDKLHKIGFPLSIRLEYVYEEHEGNWWEASYTQDVAPVVTKVDAKDPVKALLRLTLALHEAGELK